MLLTVDELPRADAWKDMVRINNNYRLDRKGKHVSRGKTCRITVGHKSKWVIVLGRSTASADIEMDLNVRMALGVEIGKSYEFTIDRLLWIQSLWFPWKASDPVYRLPAQLSFISFFLGLALGILGVVVGLIPSYRDKQVQDSARFTHIGTYVMFDQKSAQACWAGPTGRFTIESSDGKQVQQTNYLNLPFCKDLK